MMTLIYPPSWSGLRAIAWHLEHGWHLLKECDSWTMGHQKPEWRVVFANTWGEEVVWYRGTSRKDIERQAEADRPDTPIVSIEPVTEED